MTDFFCSTCKKYKPLTEKVMVKKTNGQKQAKCRGCIAKTTSPRVKYGGEGV